MIDFNSKTPAMLTLRRAVDYRWDELVKYETQDNWAGRGLRSCVEWYLDCVQVMQPLQDALDAATVYEDEAKCDPPRVVMQSDVANARRSLAERCAIDIVAILERRQRWADMVKESKEKSEVIRTTSLLQIKNDLTAEITNHVFKE